MILNTRCRINDRCTSESEFLLLTIFNLVRLIDRKFFIIIDSDILHLVSNLVHLILVVAFLSLASTTCRYPWGIPTLNLIALQIYKEALILVQYRCNWAKLLLNKKRSKPVMGIFYWLFFFSFFLFWLLLFDCLIHLRTHV